MTRPSMQLIASVLVAASLAAVGCGHNIKGDRARPDAWEQVRSSSPLLSTCFSQAPELRLQVSIAKVVPATDAAPARIERLTFRCGEEYFYPASTVKMLACIAALETLADLRLTTGDRLIDADCPLTINPLYQGDVPQDRDDSNLSGGVITVNHEVRKIFLVSDNQAFNRLYDFTGRDMLNARMHAAGLSSVSITHRLSEPRPVPDQAATAAVTIHSPNGDVEVPARVGRMELQNRGAGLRVGDGFMRGNDVVRTPMDFSGRNGVSLLDLQNALIMVVRPDIDLGLPGFVLDPQDRLRLHAAMEQYPGDSSNPVYPRANHPDNYCKFFLPGLRAWRADRHFRVLNKIGQAYGFTTENAYIEDTKTGEAFFLAATIYTNADGILNDDAYQYTTVAEPFMADLAAAVAEQVLSADRAPTDR